MMPAAQVQATATNKTAGCSGVETGRLPPPGAEVTLTVEQMGRLSNRLGN